MTKLFFKAGFSFSRFFKECLSSLMLRFISLLLVSGGGPNRAERVLDLFGTLMLHCPGRVSDNGSWSARLSLPCYLDERPTGGRRFILMTQSPRRDHPLAFFLFQTPIEALSISQSVQSELLFPQWLDWSDLWNPQDQSLACEITSVGWSPFEIEERSRSKLRFDG